MRYSTGSWPSSGVMVMRRLFLVATKLHRARNLGDDGMVLGPPRLEQLGNPRQTAGDVARLGALRRNARKHVASHHLMTGLDRQDRVDGQQIACFRAARELAHLALL